MIEKRYLMILSVAVVSILLGSLFYNSVTIADRAKESAPVEVTNFPLDEQGNLKVSTRASRTLSIVKDMNISWVGFETVNFTSNPIEVDEYGEIYIYICARNWTYSLRISPALKFSADGIESGCVSPEASYPDFIDTYHHYSENPHPKSMSAKYLIWGETVRITIFVYPKTFQGWVLVSVSLHFRD